MALQITSEKAERAVRALADATGESIDEAVEKAAEARLKLCVPVRASERMRRAYEILREFDAIPTVDHRTADEILGYDENGLPT